ncbi:MAG: hypothetical protein RMM17_12975 [Acidobacteriota bacterium]|nr:hypothetical protein [Blastocatellia bacterium]MDW8413580.1 hypothetical protein [Acidobacteriota bacterium]
MSNKKSLAGSYEIEVVLGSQQVCVLEMDLPESDAEIDLVQIDSDYGQEMFRGLFAGIFSEQGQESDLRLAQVYTLLNSISSVRDAILAGDSFAIIKKYLLSEAQDKVAKSCVTYFMRLLERISDVDKSIKMLADFSKYLLAKKELLPKISQVSKPVVRWDRVAKADFISDEPTEMELNQLEDVVEAETADTDTDWSESPEDIQPDEITDISDIP